MVGVPVVVDLELQSYWLGRFDNHLDDEKFAMRWMRCRK